MKVKIPTLLLDETKCRQNIRMMADKASVNNLIFRPHFKTHQSLEIGEWYKQEGVEAITVSSLGMAKYFADDGWREITVAFPCNINQIDIINDLAARIRLNILVDNKTVVELLEAQLTASINVYIEIDAGGGRTGLNVSNLTQIEKLLYDVRNSSNLILKGIYSHAGHTYYCKGIDDIKKTAQKSLNQLTDLKKTLCSRFGELEFCYGDTPSCSVLEKFDGIDAISPGNFVFYDIMQLGIGSCQIDQVALAMACPVVSIDKDRGEVCIYGGGIHFSKDAVVEDGKASFGIAATVRNNNWEVLTGSSVSKLSQEHGIIKVDYDELDKIDIGDTLLVLPIHSCLTAQCIGEYTLFNGSTLEHYAKKSLSFS